MNKTFFNGYLSTAPQIIAQTYPLVSLRENSVPSAGSPCKKTWKLNFDSFTPIETIAHKNNSFTVKAEIKETGKCVFLRFWPA